MQIKLTNQTTSFLIEESGLYAISITAACHKNQDLRVEIDGRSFREIPPGKNIQKFNIPAAYNGAKLRGKTQTNIFILNLEKGQHTLCFFAKNNASVSSWKLQKIDDPANVVLDLNLKAQNHDRQPLLNIILVDLPLHSIKADVEVAWHRQSFFRGDGDDVKFIIDNQIVTDNKTQFLFQATKEQAKTGTNILHKIIVTNLSAAIHYLEFIADQSPILDKLTLDLKNNSSIDDVVYPTVYEGDFEIRATTRPYGDDPNKPMIAVYLPDVNPDYESVRKTIENDRINVFFENKELQLGINSEAKQSDDIFDFHTYIHTDTPHLGWFFYGIDTTWKMKPWNWDWQNDKKWKIIKK